LVNRKLNTTPLLPSEVLPGCEFRMGIETYTVTSVEDGLYTCERLQPTFKDASEEYEVRVVPLSNLRPIDLWDYNNVLADYLMKSLDFIAEPMGIYRRMVGSYEVVVKDSFYLEDCVKLTITETASLSYGFSNIVRNVYHNTFWYFHELQKAIYDTTGQMILTPMGKRLMLTKRAIE
jgi:hypothetical protein